MEVNEYGKFLRKIVWNSGWANESQLSSNPDKKSKIKFILNLL
jgi:hypothetical protein